MLSKLLIFMSKSNISFKFGLLILNFYRYFSQKRYLTDINAIMWQFKKAHDYKLDLENPKTFNEKTQWLKIYDRNTKHTLFADKFAVRDYMKNKYGEDGLVPLLFNTTDSREVKIDNMPDFPFIIKPNHASGWYQIIQDKNKIDWVKVSTECRYWLSQNYYLFQREWQYKNIVPRIIVEKLLIPKNGGLPNNYRFHCLSGNVEVVSVNVCFGDPNSFVAKKFNKNWDILNFDFGVEIKQKNENITIEKPINFDRMVYIAEDIAKDFAYVRVDFFEVDGKLYYGEITFHDSSGYDKITPFEWDLKLGSFINLK
jgi:hypothetical protein